MRWAARLLAIVGAVGVGWVLFSARPKSVVLVYDLARAPGATALAVELRRGNGELVRHAEIRVPRGSSQVWHTVKVPAGAYELDWSVSTPSGSVSGRRPLDIEEEGTIVLPLGR